MLWPQCHELWKKSQSLSEQHRHHLNIFGWCRSKKMSTKLWRLRESSVIGCSYSFGWLYCRYWYKWKGNRLQICKIKYSLVFFLDFFNSLWRAYYDWRKMRLLWQFLDTVLSYLPCGTITTFSATFVGTFGGGETGAISRITLGSAVQILESYNGKQTQFWNVKTKDQN